MVKVIRKGLTYLTKNGELIIVGWIIDWENKPVEIDKFLEITGAKALLSKT